MALGGEAIWSVTFVNPRGGEDRITNKVQAGAYYALGITALQIPSEVLGQRSQILAQKNETILQSLNAFDDQVGEALYATTQLYLYYLNRSSDLLQALMFIRNTRKVAEAIAGIDLQTQILFGTPVSITPGAAFIDMDHYISRPFALDGNLEKKKAFLQLLGLTSSFYEHLVLESVFTLEATRFEAVSAVKAIQMAQEQGIVVVRIDATNLAAELPLLQVPASVKGDIQNAVNAGQTVIVPRQSIQINEWSGVGYIIEDPATSAAAYRISGGLAGGTLTRIGVTGLMIARLLQRTGGIAIGKFIAADLGLPEDAVAAWGFYLDIASVVAIGLFMGMGFYVPQASLTYSRESLLEIINKPTHWPFYFAGHGDRGLFAPDPRGPYVYSGDFTVDHKIVFANSCSSGADSRLAQAFGTLDQLHRGKPRDEVFAGWIGPCRLIPSTESAEYWWRNLALGMTAYEAAEATPGNILSLPGRGENVVGTPLVFHGNQDTKLREDKNFEIP